MSLKARHIAMIESDKDQQGFPSFSLAVRAALDELQAIRQQEVVQLEGQRAA